MIFNNISMKKDLYFGTDVHDAEIICSGKILKCYGDLGPGFYLTPNKFEAIEWANVRIMRTKNRPVILKFTINSSEYNKLNTYAFDDDDELRMFVKETLQIYQNRYLGYDILTSEVRLPISGHYGIQYKFQSEDALNFLKMTEKKILMIPIRWVTDLPYSNKGGGIPFCHQSKAS